MRTSAAALILAMAFLPLFTTSAAAQATAAADAAPTHSLSANVSLASEYRYRGIAQTDGDPALQGGFDYAHASGVYLGTWGSNVSWLADSNADVSNSLELDVYAGWRGRLGEVGYDAGVLRYFYPGSYPSGFVSPHTTEVYAAGSWRMFTLKYSHAVTNLFGVPDSEGAGYLDLAANVDVGRGFALLAHVGHQRIPSGSLQGMRIRSSDDCSYTDWKLGVAKTWVGLDWSLSYVDTDAKAGIGECYRSARNRDLGDATVVLTVGRSF
ncbi:MAG TPA: TorF family putative porin [Zeimonas sp.]